MNKYKITGYILLVLVIMTFIYVVNKSITKANAGTNDINTKVITEIKYMETNITKMLNLMNNVAYENYKLSTIEVQENKEEEAKTSESKEGEQSNQEEIQKVFELKINDELGNNEIKWEEIKSILDEIYVSIPVFTLDLYEVGSKRGRCIRI